MKWTRLWLLLAYIILIAGAVVMLLPLFWMVSAAFKPLDEIIRTPPTWIPIHPTLANFQGAFQQFPFARYMWNSIWTTFIIVTTVLVTSATGGYALSKFQFPGRDVIFIVLLSSLMIPFQSRMIPLYQMMVKLHLVNTYTGVVFPFLFDAMGIFLMRQFMLGLPDELSEAARIDGANEGVVFMRVVLPQVKPALSALAIFTFSWVWEEFLWPIIITNSDATRTVPVGLQYFAEQYGTRIDLQMAGALLAVLPVLVVFLILQRQFVEGITMTGLKG